MFTLELEIYLKNLFLKQTTFETAKIVKLKAYRLSIDAFMFA